MLFRSSSPIVQIVYIFGTFFQIILLAVMGFYIRRSITESRNIDIEKFEEAFSYSFNIGWWLLWVLLSLGIIYVIFVSIIYKMEWATILIMIFSLIVGFAPLNFLLLVL